MKLNELSPATLVYCVLLVFGAALDFQHPSGAGLAALACMIPGVIISFAFPMRRKLVAK